MITLKNISKKYDNYEILKNINLKIKDGITVILGPSGSGKSTLLNLIGGIDTPTTGEILYDNIKLSSYNIRRNKVSYIFQQYNLFNELNVINNIKIGSFKKIDKNILSKLKIDTLLKKYPYQLSGGQMQRVAIARALFRESDYILADEPTGALDLENTKNVLEILIKLNKNLIIVTHDERIKLLADNIIYISNGNIISNINNNKKNIEEIKWV